MKPWQALSSNGSLRLWRDSTSVRLSVPWLPVSTTSRAWSPFARTSACVACPTCSRVRARRRLLNLDLFARLLARMRHAPRCSVNLLPPFTLTLRLIFVCLQVLSKACREGESRGQALAHSDEASSVGASAVHAKRCNSLYRVDQDGVERP